MEDTVTTAGSLIKAIKAVRELGGVVEMAIVIVDREEGAREALTEIGVNMISIASIEKLRGCVEDAA